MHGGKLPMVGFMTEWVRSKGHGFKSQVSPGVAGGEFISFAPLQSAMFRRRTFHCMASSAVIPSIHGWVLVAPQVTAASGAVQLMQMQEQAKRQFAVRRSCESANCLAARVLPSGHPALTRGGGAQLPQAFAKSMPMSTARRCCRLQVTGSEAAAAGFLQTHAAVMMESLWKINVVRVVACHVL